LRRRRCRQIGFARRLVPAEPAQQIGADRRQQLIALQPAARFQRVDQVQRPRRAVDHRHRGGVVEFDHR